MQNIKSENIYEKSLFLRGIYKKDYKKIEEIFHERLYNEIQQKNIKLYDKIPQYFNSVKKWIKHTNISCWYCSNNIKHVPKFVPKSIEVKYNNSNDNKTKTNNRNNKNGDNKDNNKNSDNKDNNKNSDNKDNNKNGDNKDNNKNSDNKDNNKNGDNEDKIYNISVEGLFCSFNCSQSYIDEHYSKDLYEHINKTNMLLFLYYIFNGKIISFIKPSPSKYKMVHYGGNMTCQEYECEVLTLDINQQREIEDINFSILCETYIKNITHV